jgi:transcriptional regulator with XRE-family HTH domain
VHPTGRRLTQPGSLAERLLKLRKAKWHNQGELASALEWDRTKVSKIETGTQRPSEDEVRAWARACDHPEVADELLDLLADVEAVHKTWRSRLRGGGAAVQDDYDDRVRAAKLIRAVSPLVIPGLLQTREYAREILTQVEATWGGIDVEATVEARMRRQGALFDRDENWAPVRQFEFIMTEASARMPPCPAAVMAAQLARLLSLDLDNVTLGIIPLGVRLPLVPQNGFMLTDDIATAEGHGGEDILGERESAVYAWVFDQLRSVASTGAGAAAIIRHALDDLRSDG